LQQLRVLFYWAKNAQTLDADGRQVPNKLDPRLPRTTY
jgi:hypothetical protein